jgi:N-acetylmuramoyl-L-alanine amidase
MARLIASKVASRVAPLALPHFAQIALALLLVVAPSLASATSIIVDTGHTPLHPGATAASGRTEYYYNLDMSNAVAADLTQAGDQVTRSAADGKEIELKQRPLVNSSADLFVSIHHDSMPQAWIDAGRQKHYAGYSIFVSAKNSHYDQSLACAKQVGRALQAAGEKPSLYHATPIAGENRPLLDKRLGVHQYDDLIVLKSATMPALLVEIGVIVNPSEEVRLSQPQTRQKIAHALASGIAACHSKNP